MPERLYLIQTRAQRDYVCPGCGDRIRRGSQHFRHDPFPAGSIYRNASTTHWCFDCISGSPGAVADSITRRIKLPIVNVRPGSRRTDIDLELPLFQPLRIELVDVGPLLVAKLCNEPTLIHRLSPDQFEQFICDRLFAMGLEARRTGKINQKDGGIDIVFWPRSPSTFPFLGAAQIKHHERLKRQESASTVRDFAGAIAPHSFNAGLIVTNTSFSADAEWFAREHAKLIRLRDFADIRRWLTNNFTAEAEWREIPRSIELCPGTVIKIR